MFRDGGVTRRRGAVHGETLDLMFLFTTPSAASEPPPPAGSERPAARGPVAEAIRAGSERTGVGFDYLLSTARRESALDPDAKASTSSATGLFQFIEQTWLAMMRTDAPRAGLPDLSNVIVPGRDGRLSVADAGARERILDLRRDPAVASTMAGVLTAKNRESLATSLGREPTVGELYAAHVLGAGGAAELTRAAERTPHVPAASLFPDAARANRGLFNDRGGRARSAGELYAALTAGPTRPAAAAVASAPASRPAATPSAAAEAEPDRPIRLASHFGAGSGASFGLFGSGASGRVSAAARAAWAPAIATAPFFPTASGPASLEPPPAAPAGTESRPRARTPAPLDLQSFTRARSVAT